MVSLLEKLQIKATTSHVTDNKEQLKIKILNNLKTHDILLFSGAVSKGKFDYLQVLQELGVEKQFHRVAQRPGKPFWLALKII